MPRRTQRQRVLALIAESWTCGTTFLELRLPRATARLHELKRDGYVIQRRRCISHDWHESPQWEWRLEASPVKPEGEPCESCGGILAHVSTCRLRELEAADGVLPLGGL